MKRNKSRRTVKDNLTSQVEDEIANDNLYDNDMEKASADYYKRRGKWRIKDQQGDWWIAAGLYMILASVAFVVM